MSSCREAVQTVYDGFAKGDVGAVLAVMDDKIDWREPESMPYDDQIGPQAVAENVFARVVQDIEDFQVVPEEFVESGDTVVTIGTYRGKNLEAPFVHVWKARDGKLTYFRTYTDTVLWKEALASS